MRQLVLKLAHSISSGAGNVLIFSVTCMAIEVVYTLRLLPLLGTQMDMIQ